jgi:hypothetical protein
MTGATVNNEKFGAMVLRMAKERAASPEGKKELKGYNEAQFLEILGEFTKIVDSLPETHNIHSLYLALNWLASMVIQVIEMNNRLLMKETGGHG